MRFKQTSLFEWGPIKLSIEAEEKLLSQIQVEFSDFCSVAQERAGNADITIHVASSPRDFSCLSDDQPALLSGPTMVQSGYLIIRQRPNTFLAFHMADDQIWLGASLGRTLKRRLAKQLPAYVQRLLNARFATVEELDFVDFLYGVLLPILELAMVRKGASFIHASSVFDRLKNGALLFAGWGGVGKTSLSAYLLLKPDGRYTFLGDDQSLISQDGVIFNNPMGVHLYPYNTKPFPRLRKRLFDRMGRIEKHHWWIREAALGAKGVIRRVPPSVLYGMATTKANIIGAFFINRARGQDRPFLQECDATQFARLAANVTCFEFGRLVNIIIAGGVVGSEDDFPYMPRLDEFYRAVLDIYRNALQNVATYILTVPEGWGPVQSGEFLLTEFLGHKRL